MKFEKLPSGSYRIKKQYKGKQYAIVLDHKPTQKEAIDLLSELMNQNINTAYASTSFYKAYLDYLDIKSNILAPSTKKGYKIAFKRISDEFKNMIVTDITSDDVQKEINRDAIDHSPKSVKNLYALISVIIKRYNKKIDLSEIQLPQAEKIFKYIPTDDEVKRILEASRETRYYIPLCLATMSLRRSEICGALASDIDRNNVMTISRAKVENDHKGFDIKTTKTTESTRKILLPGELADAIRQQGYIYNGVPHAINRYLQNTQDALGIQRFTLHTLRHFFATYAHNELKLSDKQIMEIGGWKTSSVLDKVYKHASRTEEAQKEIATNLGNLF